jgi:hypothetical protein
MIVVASDQTAQSSETEQTEKAELAAVVLFFGGGWRRASCGVGLSHRRRGASHGQDRGQTSRGKSLSHFCLAY